MTAPWLILAVGNPSRGDDALGPELIERLSTAESGADDVEFLVDFQLQVEHALDLKDRHGVLFVDAARPGVVVQRVVSDDMPWSCLDNKFEAVAISTIEADSHVPPASHALRAEAVLYVARQMDDDVPPSWQLAIEGHSFALGEGLSEVAEHHLTQALDLARHWLRDRRASAGSMREHEPCMS